MILTGVAFALDGRRDYGAGIIAPEPGPARAHRANIWWLAMRLNRGSAITWLIGFAGLGTVFGFMGTSVTDLLRTNASITEVLAANAGGTSNLTFAFLVTILQLAGLVAAVAGVQMVLRIVLEENSFRVEPLLAGALQRPTYLASNLLVAYLVPAVCMLIAGTVIGLIASNAGTGVLLPDVVKQAAVTIPAVWVLISVAAAAVAVNPAVRLAGWLAIVASFGLTILGPTFKLPAWALSISPLRHVPNITAAQPDWASLWIVVAVFGALTVGAFAGFRRRDIL